MNRHHETLLWLLFEKYYRFTLAFILLAGMVALVMLAGGCARYGGTSVGVQTVSPFNNYHADENTVSAYSITFFDLGRKVTLHVQPIVPVNGNNPVLGVGIDVPVDGLFK